MLKLDALLERRPTQLSGGQRQRVAIGRAIVREPTIFLFDEPLSNLDAELRVADARPRSAGCTERLGTTMIYVTHDQVEAMTMADRIVVLRGGRVEQVGTPLELYNHARNRFVAGFIGSPQMNFLTAASPGSSAAGVLVLEAGAEALPVRGAAALAGTPYVRHPARAHRTGCRDGAVAVACREDRRSEQLGASSFLLLPVGTGERLTVHVAGQASASERRDGHSRHLTDALCSPRRERGGVPRATERMRPLPTPLCRTGGRLCTLRARSGWSAAFSHWPTTSSGCCFCAMERSRSHGHGWSRRRAPTCRGKAVIASM